MPKRIVDGEAIATSRTLREVQPETYRIHYPYLLSLALANGVFEYDIDTIWSTRYAAFMPAFSKDDLRAILNEFQRCDLLRSWTEPDGKLWGFWTKINKQGRLPPKTRLDGRHERAGPEPPPEILAASQWLTNGEPKVSLGLGLGLGSGLGSGLGEKTQPEKAPAEPPLVSKAEIRKSTNHKPRELFELYNRERGPLPAATEFSTERERKAGARLSQHTKEPERFLNRFAEAVKRAAATPWLCGENDRGWKPNFDWFVANNTNYLKVLEGRYQDGRESTLSKRTQPDSLQRPEYDEDVWVEQAAREIVNREWPFKLGREDPGAQKFMRENPKLAKRVEELNAERLKGAR